MRLLWFALLLSTCDCDDVAVPGMVLTLVTADGAFVTDAEVDCSLGAFESASSTAPHPSGVYACGGDTPGSWNVSIRWHGHEVQHGIVVIAPSGQQCHPGLTTSLRFVLTDPAGPASDAGVATNG